jgi:nitronate monooxygenase
MTLRTRFTDLVGCAVPLQQAGMGWVAGPDLAVAVAEAGGLGMIGMPMVPAATLAGMLDTVGQRTSNPVGVNFLMPFLDQDCVEVASTRARVVEFFYGEPDASLVDLVHSGGALACWQVGSLDEAGRAAGAGCDLLVVQGTEAGGHVRGKAALFSLLGRVLAAVDIPVVAAGGIATGASMAAALAAGADAVRVGTRFVATEEADVHPTYADALVRASADDTVLTEAFSVMWPDAPHRVLRSSVERAGDLDADVAGNVSLGDVTVAVPRFSPMAPVRSATGHVKAMALYAGQSVDAVARVQPAAEVLRELVDEAEARLRRR